VASHYEVLGVSRRASTEEIRRAYLDQARRLHPDARSAASADGADRSGRAMQAVNEAWRVLRDPGRRRDYDRRLAGAPSGGSTRPYAGAEDAFASDDALEPDPPEYVAAQLPETDLRPTRVADTALLVPAALLAAAVGLFVLAMVSFNPALLAGALALVLVSGCCFVVAPFLVMARERRRR
jgi:curved DNA-binding protein CbpA